jgi:glucose/arabinose dehydrogenase
MVLKALPFGGFDVWRLATLVLAMLASSEAFALAATLPAGFSESLVADGLVRPTAMQFAPDGRLFVCEQDGRVRVIRNGELLGTPFLRLSVDSRGERGLLGIAFDPEFDTNHFVYVYYTTAATPVHNRVSRFTANGDVALPGSERPILDLGNLSSALNHNGGALNFGPDRKLYVAVGDNGNSANAQTLSNRLGKILRINTDGSIPPDNPFVGTVTGVFAAIWALGLRNPFTFAFNPGGGEMFINDVGQNTWEEINDGIPGANYGWPVTEGYSTNPSFRSPRYAYDHSSERCAITGGAFYSPSAPQFPAGYFNGYFFADFCAGWIRRLDWQGANTVTTFATGIGGPVDLKVWDDGTLYYLARRGGPGNTGVIYRISYQASAPGITTHPASQIVAPGSAVTFRVVATGAAPLRYQWQRNGANIQGATASSFTIASATLADNGSRFRVIISNNVGSATSNNAVLTVTTNRPPTAAITQPATGALYSGGSVIMTAGTGTDPEDGTLPAGAFTWQVDFHHDTHTHPFMAPTTGVRSGAFTIPTTGETSANVWYRIYLTVRDSGGLTHTVQRDIVPRKVRLTLTTDPAGLQVVLDGQPRATPLSFDAVVGIERRLSVESVQRAGNGVSYQFVSWSDGGAATHLISTPAANTTYTARYRAFTSAEPPRLSAHTNGLTLSLWWTQSTAATSYVLEGGSAPGLADLLSANLGTLTSVQGVMPAGTYVARVRALNAFGESALSNEVTVTLAGQGRCATPPPPPAAYVAQASGLSASLSWHPSPSADSYVLEAGASPGAANLFSGNIGPTTSITAAAPAGVYFTRIRAVNACGMSTPSNEAPLTLGCSGNPPAPSLTFAKAGALVTLNWTPVAGAASYSTQVGSAPGLSDLVNADIGSAATQVIDVTGVAPGTYYVRILANGGCGASGPSNEAVVTVP